jgi:hypothetical protein
MWILQTCVSMGWYGMCCGESTHHDSLTSTFGIVGIHGELHAPETHRSGSLPPLHGAACLPRAWPRRCSRKSPMAQSDAERNRDRGGVSQIWAIETCERSGVGYEREKCYSPAWFVAAHSVTGWIGKEWETVVKNQAWEVGTWEVERRYTC